MTIKTEVTPTRVGATLLGTHKTERTKLEQCAALGELRGWKAAFAIAAFCVGAMSIRAQTPINGTFTTLVDFNGADGYEPEAPLVQGTDGNLYGVTLQGGGTTACSDGCGTIFRLNTAGTLTTLYRFCSNQNCGDGLDPAAGLTLGADENFYGTTRNGGGFGLGTVFKITKQGTLTTLHSFSGYPVDGADPDAALILATDGNFYGTTFYGGSGASCYGSAGCGTIFKITPEGVVTILHSFDGTDGSFPAAALLQAIDGNLYGATENGGANNACYQGCGTIFRMAPPGDTLITVHSFDGNHGANPVSALVQTDNGRLYGTAFNGALDSSLCDVGVNDLSCGTVFEITAGGTFRTLHQFDGTDGGHPVGVVLGTDGNFYGATYSGGNGRGTIFRMTSGGSVSTLHSLGSDAGAFPIGIAEATNGIFYGATLDGGTYSCSYGECGTIFREDVGLRPFVATLPASREVGQRVAILGNNLSGATMVTFNGTAATFTVVSSTEIETTVPAGATTGPVQVVTSNGTLTSNIPFRVRQ